MPSPEIISLPTSRVQEAAALSLAAFRDNVAYRVVFPNLDSPVAIKSEADSILDDLKSEAGKSDPSTWHMCILDPTKPEEESRAIVTYAQVNIKQTPSHLNGPWASDKASIPPDANHEAWNELTPITAEARARAMGPGVTYLYLGTLVTAEGARRRGYATSVMDWCKDLARKRGVPLMLQASPAGVSMYEKAGLRRVAEVKRDLAKWLKEGEENNVTEVIMKWDGTS